MGGLLLLIRRRNPGRDRDSVIDSMIVAIGIGTMQWVFLMSPVAHDSASTLLQKLVGMAYPFMDLVLLTVVIRLAMGAGKKAPSLYLMGAAALSLFLTDTLYTYISVQGLVYNQSGYLEAGWGIFYLLWGAAALHPSMRNLSDKAPDVERRMSKLRLLLLGGASLIAPGVMLIQLSRADSVDMPVLIGASVMLFVLVVLRMSGLVRRQEQSTLREKALRNAGAALVTATNRESIYAATLQAARALVGDDGGLRLLVVTEDDPDAFQVVAAAGGTEGVEGTAVSLSILPQWKRDRLQSHRSYEVPTEEAELASSLGMPPNATFVLNAPLFMKEELQGLLVIAGPASVPRAIRDSIEALSSQVALALDSALTTEILLIRQSEARFSSLVQNSSDVVMVVEADSTIRYMSPSVERVLGHTPGELEGTKLTVLINPDDRAGVLQFLTSGGREGDAHPGLTEFRMKHRDDFWLHVETLRTNLLHDENVRGIVLNTRDVSERKAFEEQLAAPGVPRRGDGAREPGAVQGPRRAHDRAAGPGQPPGLDPVHGPGRLQDDQRLSRPRGGRPDARRGRRAAEELAPAGRHRRSARRRRVRDPARGRRGRGRRGRGRRQDPRVARGSVPPRGQGGVRPRLDRHRDRRRPDRRPRGRRGAAAERGRRDVHGEGGRQGPVPGLRTRDARHGPAAPRAQGGPAARGRQR